MIRKDLPWYYRRWPIILMLFFVLGPLGLPLVYKSPEFSKRAKVFWTVLMVLFTAVMIWKSYALIIWMVDILTSGQQITITGSP